MRELAAPAKINKLVKSVSQLFCLTGEKLLPRFYFENF